MHNGMIFPVHILFTGKSKSLTGGGIARWNDILDDLVLDGKSDLCFTDKSALVSQYQVNIGHPPGDAFEHRSSEYRRKLDHVPERDWKSNSF